MKYIREIIRDRRRLMSVILFGVACLLVGIGISFLAPNDSGLDPSCVKTYHYINKKFGCQKSEEKDAERIASTGRSLSELIQKEEDAKKASDISVYFRDLTNTKWVGVNENENYSPGSLLKLPLLIAYFKYADIDPRVLDQTLIYKASKKNNPDKLEVLPQPKVLQDGTEYSVAQLLAFMIQESSNSATAVLYNSLNQTLIDEVYDDLGVALPIDGNTTESFVSASIYANIFRSLYNASYLPRASAEKALELMSNTSFMDGLVAGVPAGTIVSHKFGDREVKDQSGEVSERQLHDCGIVYKPDHPYILCVMTKGDDFKNLKQTIQDISKLIYDQTN